MTSNKHFRLFSWQVNRQTQVVEADSTVPTLCLLCLLLKSMQFLANTLKLMRVNDSLMLIRSDLQYVSEEPVTQKSQRLRICSPAGLSTHQHVSSTFREIQIHVSSWTPSYICAQSALTTSLIHQFKHAFLSNLHTFTATRMHLWWVVCSTPSATPIRLNRLFTLDEHVTTAL